MKRIKLHSVTAVAHHRNSADGLHTNSKSTEIDMDVMKQIILFFVSRKSNSWPFFGVYTDTYVIYQSVLEKKTYESQISDS